MRQLSYYIVLLIFALACDAKKNEVEPEYGFTRIVGSGNFDGEYYPWDIKETSDGGFLILSSSNSTENKDINLLKVNALGEFEWEVNHSTTFKNPLPILIQKDGKIYFFATHRATFTLHLLEVNLNGGGLIDVRSYADFFSPVAASAVPGGYLVQCFDSQARRTRLMRLNGNFNEVWRENYGVNEDPPEFYEHFFLENPLPFFCGYVANGTAAGSYYFGGLRNYRITTAFVRVGDGGVKKLIEGQRYDAGISNMLHLDGNNFFVIVYNNAGENSVLSRVQINPNNGDSENSQTFFPERIDYELPKRVLTRLKKIVVNGREVVTLGTSTKSNEAAINFYDPASGVLLAAKRIGYRNPYQMGNVIPTSDGALMFVCKTSITGRFSRIALIKMPAEEVAELF